MTAKITSQKPTLTGLGDQIFTKERFDTQSGVGEQEEAVKKASATPGQEMAEQGGHIRKLLKGTLPLDVVITESIFDQQTDEQKPVVPLITRAAPPEETATNGEISPPPATIPPESDFSDTIPIPPTVIVDLQTADAAFRAEQNAQTVRINTVNPVQNTENVSARTRKSVFTIFKGSAILAGTAIFMTSLFSNHPEKSRTAETILPVPATPPVSTDIPPSSAPAQTGGSIQQTPIMLAETPQPETKPGTANNQTAAKKITLKIRETHSGPQTQPKTTLQPQKCAPADKSKDDLVDPWCIK
jgi:hypothetical protein